MAENIKGWEWFDRTGKDLAAAEDDSDGNSDIARAYARCFGGDDGQAVLVHLRSVTLDRILGPGSPDALLRHLEGQRQLVAQILAMAEKGRLGKT